MEQIVIVGAGQAGHCAAFELRRQRYGGRIVLIGEEALAPYERPLLSKAVLVAPALPQPQFFSPPARYREQEIDLVLSRRAEAIDRAGRVHLAGGGSVPYDRLLLATGGTARRLAIRGGEYVACLRTWADAEKIRAQLKPGLRLLCIGGGVIGLEIAASASALGCSVTVLEAGPTIMARCLAPRQADVLLRRHRDAGVTIHLEQSLSGVEKGADGFVATLTGGEEIKADLVVAGVGMSRNTALAEDAGLEVDNGIAVDLHARTADEAIFAAGDVAAFEHALYPGRMRLESWYHAQYHGACAGRAMAGVPRPYDDVPRFWTDQYDLNIQVAGFPAEAVTETVVGKPGEGTFTVLHANPQGRLVGVTAVNQPRSMRPAIEAIRRGGQADPALLDPRRPAAARRGA
ncbi:NAD(P)/FAD-dependent oxidoreductase [Shinella sp. BYT-45]|uniref:NAD(P)/FAD-dependent oxidoreductase n=1 Tax=Shinella sp. BYT-45 TaxID=3377377 RepID=UPI00397EE231